MYPILALNETYINHKQILVCDKSSKESMRAKNIKFWLKQKKHKIGKYDKRPGRPVQIHRATVAPRPEVNRQRSTGH